MATSAIGAQTQGCASFFSFAASIVRTARRYGAEVLGMTAPERHRTLTEVCELYFPGISPCALRWMIKRRGYAHSRWGREYRLTDSHVAAIQQDLARPAKPGQGRTATATAPGTSAHKKSPKTAKAADGEEKPAARRQRGEASGDPKRALAERLSSPLSVTPSHTR